MAEEYQELLIRGLTKFKEWEFSTVPNENEIEHIFSDKYLKAKEKLLNKLGHSYWKYVNTIAKKVAIIILTLIVVLSSLMSVEAIREKVINFVFKIYSTFTEIEYFDQNNSKYIDTYYSIHQLPKTYTKIFTNSNESISTTYWSNASQEDIILVQNLTSTKHAFNSEHGDISEVIINDTPCLVCKNQTLYCCYWEFDGYRFELVYPLDLGEEFMSDVVGKLVEIDPEDINN